MRFASIAPGLYNWLVSHAVTSRWIKRIAGFAPARSLPPLSSPTLRAWQRRRHPRNDTRTGVDTAGFPQGRVHLFCDEFTNYQDSAVGIKAITLLNRLGYEVILPRHVESGRAQLSKGLVRAAQACAIANVEALQDVVTEKAPLIGLEPSALLTFRDEVPDLVSARLKPAARVLAGRALLFEEFIAREVAAGRIRPEAFTEEPRVVHLHGHCHQKALSSLKHAVTTLQLPVNYTVRTIPSGCCGMAGSFGFEAEHYGLSQQIGELVLFPALRQLDAQALVCAPGTSCRHQIRDALGRTALHPAEVLFAALRPPAPHP